MARGFVFALTLAVLAAPAPAAASTLGDGGNGVLRFTASPGTVNVVQFRNGPNVTVRRVAGDSDPITSAPASCIPAQQGVEYLCQNVTRIVVDVSGGNDSVDASGLTGVTAGLNGGDGADTLTGGPLADTLDGGPGTDTLDGLGGPDTLNGGAGNDSLEGNAGNDAVNGGDGDDDLGGGGGADVLSGGAGIDSALFGTGRASVSVSIDGVPNDGAVGEGDNVLTDVEDVTANADGTGTVAVTGSAQNNLLAVDSGVAVITGGAGADTMIGGPLDDMIDARDGYADRVFCGAGTDTALVDPLDTVSQSCENAPVTVVPGGADDRPPTVTWSAPANAARFRGNVVTTLAVEATDDRGVAMVQFYDDDRLVCEDTAAPYTCAYEARGDDVGRNTLIATAIDGANQATSAVRPVTVNRFRPTSLSLRVPSRDRRAPYTFRARGRLAGAGSCSGTVRITVKAGRRTVSSRRARVTRTCRYSLTVRFRSRPASRLRFSARFNGNRSTLPRTSRNRTARLG